MGKKTLIILGLVVAILQCALCQKTAAPGGQTAATASSTSQTQARPNPPPRKGPTAAQKRAIVETIQRGLNQGKIYAMKIKRTGIRWQQHKITKTTRIW